jgi:hypothetical protein
VSSVFEGPVTVAPHVQTPAEPADFVKLKQEFNKVATSNIGKWVAGGVALAVPIVTALCAWLQKEVGINLDPASLTAFITSMAAGLALMGFKWLSNHGNWERAMVEAYQIFLTGQGASSTTSQVIVAQGHPAPAAQPPAQPQP